LQNRSPIECAHRSNVELFKPQCVPVQAEAARRNSAIDIRPRLLGIDLPFPTTPAPIGAPGSARMA